MTKREMMLSHKNGADKRFYWTETERRIREKYSEEDERNLLRNMLTDGDAVEQYLADLAEIKRAVKAEMEASLGEIPDVPREDLTGKTGVIHRMSAMESATSIAFVTMAERGEIDGVTASEHTALFSPWTESVSYTDGALRVHGGKLYRCIQPHISQRDWSPDAAPSLWTPVSDPEEKYPAWSQPVGAHDAYAKGDTVTHYGTKWSSEYDANVWEPGVYGWSAINE